MSKEESMIGISCGDFTGIGPEVTLKALATQKAKKYLLLGDFQRLQQLNESLGLNLPLVPLPTSQTPPPADSILCHSPANPLPEGLQPGDGVAAAAALDCLRDGAKRCLRGELDALVTAPVNKASILRLGQPFVGQTEFLAELAGTKRFAMMLVGDDGQGHFLRVILATTHLPIRKVADSLSASKIQTAIELAAEACRDLNLPRARIGVCGLNPHAGEEGELGREEIELIAPAVARVRANGIDVAGPFAADTLFYHAYHGAYDAVVAMYHDQGLVPLKMIGFDRGVNVTLGLPFVRTSPDHGTAYDIAGQGRANPASMIAALQLAEELAVRR